MLHSYICNCIHQNIVKVNKKYYTSVCNFVISVLPRSRGASSPNVEKKSLKVNENSSTTAAAPFYRISSPVFVAKVPFRLKWIFPAWLQFIIMIIDYIISTSLYIPNMNNMKCYLFIINTFLYTVNFCMNYIYCVRPYLSQTRASLWLRGILILYTI